MNHDGPFCIVAYLNFAQKHRTSRKDIRQQKAHWSAGDCETEYVTQEETGRLFQANVSINRYMSNTVA